MEKPEIRFETERLKVRSICDADKDYCMDLRMENSVIWKLYENKEELREKEWQDDLNNEKDIILAAFLKENDIFVARASFQDYRNEAIEFSYDVVSEYRKQGIATELVKGMLDVAQAQLNAKQVIIKMNRDNIASKSIAEHFGGVLEGTEPTWFSKALTHLMKELEDIKHPEENADTEKQEALEMIEEGKNGVLVYRINL